MMKQAKHLFLLSVLLLYATAGRSQNLSDEARNRIALFIDSIARQEISVGRIAIDSVAYGEKQLTLLANMNCSYIPFREENVAAIYQGVSRLLPDTYRGWKVEIRTNGRSIEEQIPLYYRTGKKKKDKQAVWAPQGGAPIVTEVNRPWQATNGLQNRHIALWQSHGWYYEGKLNRWEWQRARIFQTVEDLYTQSYVLPFLVPMLEHAGANVLLPRERDTQTCEVIVDNDGPACGASLYCERSGDKPWAQGTGVGFAHKQSYYNGFENPFQTGSYRQAETIKKGTESVAEWIPEIEETGMYAVYVAYRSLPQSSDKARYTVVHQGGSTSFDVNQRMGGGTWIYLGTFPFEKGCQGKVTLSNRSDKAGAIVTADGVKIGGGMGNIARYIAPQETTERVKSSQARPDGELKGTVHVDMDEEKLQTSGYPRWCEAARYWLQWAGAPDSIYSESRGRNDYTDDYKSRGLWVNWLAGGSQANPEEQGLNIPIDLAFAFHTDAGTTLNDSIIGTLGIYHTESYDRVYANGASRYLARDLTDLVQSQIVNDVRQLYEPQWSRRGMWNKSYYEARAPRVPTMLLELLSHQNLADMRYGLDPRFRFTVSRAIYKGMLRFVCSMRGMEPVVQPLPVEELALQLTDDGGMELTWQPVDDPLEPSAKAEQYIVYTRIGNRGFDNGVAVKENRYRTTLPAGVVCSYKVVAVNRGGRSFDSEILSAGRAFCSKGTVMVVNGFDRISAPVDFVAPGEAGKQLAGFLDEVDHGVPYLKDISYIGTMKEYRRHIPWMDDDASGFGDSYGDYETQVVAGNSLDYPAVHGEALLKAGYSFASCSNEAVERGSISLNRYRYVDLILGKQCQTKMGRGGVTALQYKTFNEAMQQALTAYCKEGGRLIASGAFVGSDLWDNRVAESRKEDQLFATEILKYKWRVGQAARRGEVKCVDTRMGTTGERYTFCHQLDSERYVVESPDAIEPACPEASTVLRYAENNLSAAVAYRGNDYRTCILGFPIESLQDKEQVERLMRNIMNFMEEE